MPAGEDFVRQHERVLQQAGGRTAGPPAPAYAPAAVSWAAWLCAMQQHSVVSVPSCSRIQCSFRSDPCPVCVC